MSNPSNALALEGGVFKFNRLGRSAPPHFSTVYLVAVSDFCFRFLPFFCLDDPFSCMFILS